MKMVCSNCGRDYPAEGTPYRCMKCGGLFDIPSFDFDLSQVDVFQPGMWRYRHSFVGLSSEAEAVTLGEGDTPLIWSEGWERQVAFKCEQFNPSGSFKDRGSSLLISFLKSRGVTNAVEDSSGNAGASFAAYAARAGMQAGVYLPASASGAKREQIGMLGANLHLIEGTRSAVTFALEADLERSGAVYASHAYLPVNLPGYATSAYEIYFQLGCVPGTVVVPVGQGGLLLGLYRGFLALKKAGLTDSLPYFIGVQARACSPLWVLSTAGYSAMGFITEGATLAEGVRVLRPLRAGALLKIAEDRHGEFVPVDEVDILLARDELAHKGLYIEPTSAISWAALGPMIDRLQDPIVVMLTGSGYKYNK